MPSLTDGKRDDFLRAEAVFGLRAVGILLEAGILRSASYGEHGLKKLKELLDEFESQMPDKLLPAERADLDFIRERFRY